MGGRGRGEGGGEGEGKPDASDGDGEEGIETEIAQIINYNRSMCIH